MHDHCACPQMQAKRLGPAVAGGRVERPQGSARECGAQRAGEPTSHSRQRCEPAAVVLLEDKKALQTEEAGASWEFLGGRCTAMGG